MSPEWLGRVRYREAHDRQLARRRAIIEGTADEAFWLLEHEPVITTGRRVVDLDEESLRDAGIDVVRTERGGLATWHGPGQLAGYVLIDLKAHGLMVRTMVAALEQGLIDWLGTEGVTADRRQGFPGVWVGADKIAALGLHFSRGVSMHGFALNLCPSLDGFARIVPCGITDGGVTTFERVTGRRLEPEQAASAVVVAVWTAIERADRRILRVKSTHA